MLDAAFLLLSKSILLKMSGKLIQPTNFIYGVYHNPLDPYFLFLRSWFRMHYCNRSSPTTQRQFISISNRPSGCNSTAPPTLTRNEVRPPVHLMVNLPVFVILFYNNQRCNGILQDIVGWIFRCRVKRKGSKFYTVYLPYLQSKLWWEYTNL